MYCAFNNFDATHFFKNWDAVPVCTMTAKGFPSFPIPSCIELAWAARASDRNG